MGFIVRKATSADALDIAIVHTVSWQSAYKGIVDDEYLANLNIDNKAKRFKRELIEFNGTHFLLVKTVGKRLAYCLCKKAGI